MLDGPVADPKDAQRYFMNSGYAYLGLQRVSEMLVRVNPKRSEQLAREAREFKQDIRAALRDSLARGPVVPLGDGTWCPSAGPWAEARGPLALQADGGTWFTHGSHCREMLGPLYLVFQEVIEPRELAAEFALNFYQELFLVRNVALSQPYYSRHDIAHLRRGEVKAFLKTFYNTVAGLIDRQTYTFWEHYYHASPHKTHEEAWFLMQVRWMLYLEEGTTLRLLPGVPRAWLEDGKRIEFENMSSYFGPISLRVQSKLGRGSIEAEFTCRSRRVPRRVLLRLPHPKGRRASEVTGGVYQPKTETVCIEPFQGRGKVGMRF